jgi:hypothetical protein
MTDQFFKLLHSGAVNADQITDKDRRALVALIKKSLKQRGGGGQFDAPDLLRESS